MDNTLILLMLAVLAAAGFVVWSIVHRRSKRLQSHFGPEYERTVATAGSRSRAEQELVAREERARRYQIRPLTPQEHDHYVQAWQTHQARFVDDPLLTILEAEELVTELMRTRGYPVSDFEQQAADLSVDHPLVVEHYRAARASADRGRRGQSSTEELRQAMRHYRTLFDKLLETSPYADEPAHPRGAQPLTPDRPTRSPNRLTPPHRGNPAL